MKVRKRVIEPELEAWQFENARSLDAAPPWVTGIFVRLGTDPDQADKTRDAKAVLHYAGGELMLYAGHWLVRHEDGSLEPMTAETFARRFEPV